MESILKLDMRLFYSEEIFDINDCSVNDTGVLIRLKSKKHECECPDCHQISNHYHGTYERSVQDLPILGKNTSVIITAHEYECQNAECPTKTIVERYDHFLGYYGRFTERCEDFIATLALETSCEGASRICRYLGIQVSGDTIIRILKKRFAQMEIEAAGSCIGIDDFSTKKGSTYCTVICNTDSHKPIAVLEGRDGSSLKEWLIGVCETPQAA
ncbi:transposase family protein [Sellimonas catena]|uniref:transposase family protein n=1 Tax=Sellimonas catena TaxID=2994035 RepID=UPI00386DC373